MLKTGEIRGENQESLLNRGEENLKKALERIYLGKQDPNIPSVDSQEAKREEQSS